MTQAHIIAAINNTGTMRSPSMVGCLPAETGTPATPTHTPTACDSEAQLETGVIDTDNVKRNDEYAVDVETQVS